MLQVFSSVSWSAGSAFASTIILENNKRLISFFCNQYENISSHTAAELLGVLQSLEAIVSDYSQEHISIFTNNHGITSKLNAHILYDHNPQGAYPELWDKLYRLVDCFEWARVYRYRSTEVPYNPVHACRALCTSAARHRAKEVPACTQL